MLMSGGQMHAGGRQMLGGGVGAGSISRAGLPAGCGPLVGPTGPMAAILIASNCTLDGHSGLGPMPSQLTHSGLTSAELMHGQLQQFAGGSTSASLAGPLYYGTLQPPNRRVRVYSNNLNGLVTMDDLHMHTDV